MKQLFSKLSTYQIYAVTAIVGTFIGLVFAVGSMQ